MDLLKKILESMEAFEKANRIPPNIIVLHPNTARSVVVEANTKKGVLVKNSDGSKLIYGMLLIEDSDLRNGDVLVLQDSIELKNSVRAFLGGKEKNEKI
jgi:hypothetical protein